MYHVNPDGPALGKLGSTKAWEAGEEIPEDAFPSETFDRFLAKGRILKDKPAEPLKPKPKRKKATPWTFDPAKLVDLDLGTLNAKILDIDPKAGAADSVGDAIEFLSQDFEG